MTQPDLFESTTQNEKILRFVGRVQPAVWSDLWIGPVQRAVMFFFFFFCTCYVQFFTVLYCTLILWLEVIQIISLSVDVSHTDRTI